MIKIINHKSNQFIKLRFKDEIVPSLTLFPVCLPPPIENDSVTDYTGQEVFVTGYGCTDEKCGFGDLSQQLQEISIEVISNDLAMCWFLNNCSLCSSAKIRTSMIGGIDFHDTD